MGFRFGDKNKISCILAAAACLLMMLFPEVTVSATKGAVRIWMNAVVPSLLPFMMLGGYIKKAGMKNMAGRGWYPVLMAFFSGYPMGAKLVGEQYRSGFVDAKDLQRLLCFAMITGPAFLIGGIGVSFYRQKSAGYILAFSHYAAALLCGFLYGGRPCCCKRSEQRRNIKSNLSDTPFTDCILESFRTLGIVLAYIVLFMIATELIDEAGILGFMEREFTGFCKGILEMTVGCCEIAAGDSGLTVKLSLSSFVISFGGLSVIGQTMSMLADCPINIWQILHIKICHGLLSGILTFIISLFVI